MSLLNNPRNILAKLAHRINTLFIGLNITGLEAHRQVPVPGSCSEHPADTEVMVDGINCTDRSGPALCRDPCPGVLAEEIPVGFCDKERAVHEHLDLRRHHLPVPTNASGCNPSQLLKHVWINPSRTNPE